MNTVLGLLLLGGVRASRLGHHGDHGGQRQIGPQRAILTRAGRRVEVQGGIDFSLAELDPETGKMCILEVVEVDTLVKEPILQCTHKNVEQCHYTYITEFRPTQEKICQENFQKTCQITFKQQALNETVRKCYKPVEKVCNGEGPEECRTIYESSCSTKYVEKSPGKFVGDTSCEKLPVEICGAGCVFQEGPEACHDNIVASVMEIPEEVCDLNPQKTCRYTTKLVPSLSPQQECTIVPKETCHLTFSSPKPGKKPLQTKWCLDESEVDSAEGRNAAVQDVSNLLGDSQGAATDSDAQFQTAEYGDYKTDYDDVMMEDKVPSISAPQNAQSFYGVDSEEEYAEPVQQFYGAPREARRASRRSRGGARTAYRRVRQ